MITKESGRGRRLRLLCPVFCSHISLLDLRNSFRCFQEERTVLVARTDTVVDLFREVDEEGATWSDIENRGVALAQQSVRSEKRLGKKIE